MPLTTLVGTFHVDVCGEELIGKALSELNPEIIVAESNTALDIKAKKAHEIWSGLFDYLGINEDLRKKFFAVSTEKEHVLSMQYAKDKGIPFFMVDLPEELSIYYNEIANHERLTCSYRDLSIDDAREMVIEKVEFNYRRHLTGQKLQKKNIYNYSLLTSNSVRHIGKRDEYMAAQIKNIISENPDKKICGFFGLLHLIDPKSEKVKELFDEDLKNLRYHLGEDIRYMKLIDFEQEQK